MFQFRPVLESFEERLAPTTFLKWAGYTVNSIILPPSDGGDTGTTPTTPTTPTVPPPPPPPPPSTGGL